MEVQKAKTESKAKHNQHYGISHTNPALLAAPNRLPPPELAPAGRVNFAKVKDEDAADTAPPAAEPKILPAPLDDDPPMSSSKFTNSLNLFFPCLRHQKALHC